ncbi:Outer membrane protein [Colletotrichum scovillei]|uniref:Outer membrane protein n=3 Tax=Colletotrichum scovillei TaxID=1209932 RepID=A0A9P7R6Y3_9PEZI|nr:Outer membrane protein [Colletotrichum scovillei]KAG7069088.1 Outer membrane protein [Colletotrichum scovillei]KAG7073040.1 Outer membrane protein [Colletotrichum scovillei]
MLSTVQVVVDALLDVLIEFADSAIGLLDTKVHIPVISDILNDIGIPDVSYLDLVCWIPAMSYTVIYKIANQEAPFAAHEAEVQAFIAADNWEALQTCLGPKQSRSRAESPRGQEGDHMVTAVAIREPSNTVIVHQEQHSNTHRSKTSVTSISSAASVTSTSTAPTSPTSTRSNKPADRTFRQEIYHLGHLIDSTTRLMAAYVDYCEVLAPAADNPYSTFSTVLLVLGESSAIAADIAVENAPLEDSATSALSKILTLFRVAALVGFNELVQHQVGHWGFQSMVVTSDLRVKGAGIDAILAIPAVMISLDHLCEIARDVAGGGDMNWEQGAAVTGEFSNIASYVSRICYYFAAQATPAGPQFAGIMVFANIAGAGLEFAEAEM